MVLNHVSKFHKILIETIRLRERMLLMSYKYGWMYRMDGRTYICMDRGNTKCPSHCHDGVHIKSTLLPRPILKEEKD